MEFIVLWGKKITNKMYSGDNGAPLTLQLPMVLNILAINPFKARFV
jgi:hypothetical protein